MRDKRSQQEKDFTSSLISALATLDPPPTKEQVTEKANQFSEILNYDGNLNNVIAEAMIAVDSRMGKGTSLVDFEAEHDDEWIYKRDDINWVYSDAYEKHLKQEKWHPNIVRSLGDVGMKILGHLQDPTSEGAWNRRGLVIGHVQSGKTANYIGLLAKAADAGYKFIIVIAGIHNNLRKQTQERIDEGFLGRSSDPDQRHLIGVGLHGGFPHPATLTTIYNDFNKDTAARSGWQINDFSKPIILVIKKNVKTLEYLHDWLKDMNAQGDGRISDVPMLLIDDEADNASINTNKPDLDPTKTNAMIRKILGLFAKSCYLGYTATPFANIFINPEAYDDEVREELFPRDFIYCLDAPNTYFGPEKVFLNEVSSERIVAPISDCENHLPIKHKKDDVIEGLPPSLYRSINQFIIIRAIRNLRGQQNKHCSMMVNLSRFVDVQNTVRSFISEREKRIREAVKANYAMPDTDIENNEYMATLKDVFLQEFNDSEFSWPEVKKYLWSVFENLRIYVVNSKSDEALDYKKYERDGIGLTAIAIGGLSLSRGLTIEGLCVSYMYRNTRMYDTLMQMGRWFGYRPNYEDLCKVHLSSDSINWYSHIAEASEELRQQVKRMRRDRLSPKQFGLYVKSHPDTLLVTAANKMGTAEKVTVKQNYSGRIRESHVLPTDRESNQKNEELIQEFWKRSFDGELEPSKKGWFARDVASGTIEEFLQKFKTHTDFTPLKDAAISYLRAISDRYPIGDIALISISGNNENSDEFRLGHQERSAESVTNKSTRWILAKNRVASRGDEKIGLSDTQIEKALSIALDNARNEGKIIPKTPSDIHFREIRQKPLLMIHMLEPKGGELPAKRVPAFGLSFPFGEYLTEIEVVANKVWVENTYGELFDNPDEDEDHDDEYTVG